MSDPIDDHSRDEGTLPPEHENDGVREGRGHQSNGQSEQADHQDRFRRLVKGDAFSVNSSAEPDTPSTDEPGPPDVRTEQSSPGLNETEPYNQDLTTYEPPMAADVPTPQDPAIDPRPELPGANADVLPQRVPETDLGATQVGPSAFLPPAQPDEPQGNRWKRCPRIYSGCSPEATSCARRARASIRV